MEDIKIPIDKQLEEFGNHILANPRTFYLLSLEMEKVIFLMSLRRGIQNILFL